MGQAIDFGPINYKGAPIFLLSGRCGDNIISEFFINSFRYSLIDGSILPF